MRTTRAHVAAHGRPVAYYSDRYGVFRVNRRDREGEPTQFTRALRTLDVESIHAGSPQAKGRVAGWPGGRANRTLQDRLVKEMRLRGIGGIATGNGYLPAFMADCNRRFGVAPRNPSDAHRAVLHDERELDLILCEQHACMVTKGLTISFEGSVYQVTGHGKGYQLRGAAVTVCKGFDGAVTVLRDGRKLPVRLLGKGEEPLRWRMGRPCGCALTAPRRPSRPAGTGSPPRTTHGASASSRRRRRRPPFDTAPFRRSHGYRSKRGHL